MSLSKKQSLPVALVCSLTLVFALVVAPAPALAEDSATDEVTPEVVSQAEETTEVVVVPEVVPETPTEPVVEPSEEAPAEPETPTEPAEDESSEPGDNESEDTDKGSEDTDEDTDTGKTDESGATDTDTPQDNTDQSAKTDTTENTTDANSSSVATDATNSSNQTVADGYYAIVSTKDNTKVLDAVNGSTANGTNVQIYTSTMCAAQKWYISYHAEDGGYYTIATSNDLTKVLDVANGKAYNGANVQLWENNGTLAQRWSIIKTKGYWEILSQLGNYCLNLEWGGTSNGTNIWIYAYDGTPSCLFNLLQFNPAAPSGNTQPIKDGIYSIATAKNSNYVLDVASGSFSNGANIQLWRGNGTVAQRYYFAYDASDGYYTITSLNSAKVLDVANGNILPGANVWQFENNASDAQKWAVRYDSTKKYYYIVNKKTGLALDLAWGNVSNGGNIWGYTLDKSIGQSWILTNFENFIDADTNGTIYTIYSAKDTSKVFDMTSGSSKSGTALQIYTSNNTLAQKFEVYKVATNTYRIRTGASGGWLTDSSAKVVQNGSSTTASSKANTWIAKWTGTFFSLFNQLTGRVMDLTSGSVSSSTKVQTFESNDTAAQHFILKPSRLMSDGYYTFSSLKDTSYAMSVANSSLTHGSYLQINKSDNSNTQKFKVTWTGSYYVITASNTSQALNPEWGSTSEQTKIWIYDKDGTIAQSWKIEIADGGGVTFKNAKSGYVMDIAWGTMANGTSIWQFGANNTPAQGWKVTSVQLMKWIVRDGNLYYSDGSLNYTGAMTLDGVTYTFKSGTGELIGVQVSNSKISSYVSWMLDKAVDNKYGYDQAYRWGERGDYDCSSLVISACKAAGINTGSASYTGDMRSNFISHGFTWISNFLESDLQIGDILLNEGRHTAVYIGNGYIVHASGNENGQATGGQPGDQTGKEICVRSYYWYTYGGWNGILRLT